MQNTAVSSSHYLISGFRLLSQRGIKRFVFIPLSINIVLLGFAFVYLINSIAGWSASVESFFSGWGWFEWLGTTLAWLLWPLIILGAVVFVFFFFSMLANWIAAPFNGLLSEAVERKLRLESGEELTSYSQENSLKVLLKDTPRLLKREWRKLIYYIPRAILCLLLLMIPLLGGLIFPFIWFGFNAWMMSIQYVDYPLDNQQKPFEDTLAHLRKDKSLTLTFGSLVMLLTMVPFINLLVMPAAVCGGTQLWFENFRRDKELLGK